MPVDTAAGSGSHESGVDADSEEEWLMSCVAL
jgi:hypothetical protein